MIGIGNPGRGDDGLGVSLVWSLSVRPYRRVSFESNYQLNVEDALAISVMDAAIFVDANRSGPGPFSFYRLASAVSAGHSSHVVNPPAVLAFCRELYGKDPPCFVLAIRGYRWDLGSRISQEASKNLAAASGYLDQLLSRNSIAALIKAAQPSPVMQPRRAKPHPQSRPHRRCGLPSGCTAAEAPGAPAPHAVAARQE